MSKLSHLCCTLKQWKWALGCFVRRLSPQGSNSKSKWVLKTTGGVIFRRSAICHWKGSLKVSFFTHAAAESLHPAHVIKDTFWDTEERKKPGWALCSRQCKDHSCILTSSVCLFIYKARTMNKSLMSKALRSIENLAVLYMYTKISVWMQLNMEMWKCLPDFSGQS